MSTDGRGYLMFRIIDVVFYLTIAAAVIAPIAVIAAAFLLGY